MTFIAMLFAFSPSLELALCAAEGCDEACYAQSPDTVAADTTLVDAGQTGSDNCVGDQCPCIAGHCNHAAIAVPAIDAALTPVHRVTTVRVEANQLTSAFLQTLDRPPRA